LTKGEELLIELFGLIHSEGLWHLLSPNAVKIGSDLYKKVTGEDIHAPRIGGMKLTIEQHLQLVSNILPISAKQTEFWKIVTQICWIMNAVEKDPFMAKLISESETPEDFFKSLEVRRD
jgi:hypothetical protein